MDNKDKMAFPFYEPGTGFGSVSEGLSKRELIAAMCLQGILSNHWCQNDYKNDIHAIGTESTAEQAVKYTDALLAELSKL